MEIPNPTTTLFGRDDELRQVARYLDDSDHRLVTLVGPGGIGKTRLGLEAARRYGELTKDGAIFIDLQAVDEASGVALALASSLQIPIQDQEAAPAQIAQFLADKETLLFFDNFEQVAEAAPFVGLLLEASPGTTALVTSRVPLRLSQEWLIHVDGLPVPQPNRPRSDDSPALLLFVERARQVRPDLVLEQERSAIEQICRLTEGMPLAIEIAASWARVLDCSDIAAEISRSRQFLSTQMQDVPERHRSIQAVFGQAMQMLDSDEQKVFERLSIFRGGFGRAAAEKVAGASLLSISSLIDRSLIRSTTGARYRIHELVRQFAADRLAADEHERASVEAAHSAYYMDLLAELHDAMSVTDQLAATEQLDPDSENVTTAWRYAVDNLEANRVAAAAVTIAQFIQYRGRYAYGGRVIAEAVDRFRNAEQSPEVKRAQALLLIEHGWFNLRQGRLEESESAFRESARLHTDLKMKPIRGFAMDPDLGSAYVASTGGDIERAMNLAKQGLRASEADGNLQHFGVANQLLGHLALRAGDAEMARRYGEAALDASERQGEVWFTSYCHNDLGTVAVAEGEYAEAREHFTESLRVGELFNDRANIGLSLAYLGEVAALVDDLDQAREHFESSRQAYGQLGDRGGIVRATAGLGLVAARSGQYGDSCRLLDESLETAVDIGFVAMVMDVLCAIGELALEAGMDDEATGLVGYVASQGSTESRTRARIRKLSVSAAPGGEIFDSLEHAVDYARRVLAEVRRSTPSEPSHDGPTVPAARQIQALADPLTEREIEVLGMIARGLPNKRIADELFISLGTVKWHSNQIYIKLGVHNRTGAVVKAQELGLLAAGA